MRTKNKVSTGRVMAISMLSIFFSFAVFAVTLVDVSDRGFFMPNITQTKVSLEIRPAQRAVHPIRIFLERIFDFFKNPFF